MRIDFHSHVKLSKKSQFMPDYFREMMKEAKASGLTALAMTEHFNTSRFFDVFDFIDANYKYEHGYYLIDGLKLFPGIEVDIRENGHILLIGSRETILRIRSSLENHLTEDTFISFDRLMNLTENEHILKIGAHPFRKSTPLHHLDLGQLRRLDAFDLNGKDLYAEDMSIYRRKLADLAQQVGLPIVGGSDTHHFLQYGSVYNDFDEECHTVEELKTLIKTGSYEVNISVDLEVKVRAATIVKKLLKEKLADGKKLTSSK